MQPVDTVALNIPDYFDIVKEPMDFSTICSQIENHSIQTKEEYAARMRLVFSNALLYNKAGSDVSIMAHTLSDQFEKEMVEITGKVLAAGEDALKPTFFTPTRRERAPVYSEPQKIPRLSSHRPKGGERSKSSRQEDMEMMSSLIEKLRGTISRMEQEINEKTGKAEKTVLDNRPMTVEEKKALSLEINQLNGADLAGIVSIIRENVPADSMQQEDIEIDLDTMPNEVLRKMEQFIRDCKQVKKETKRHRRTHSHTPHEKIIDFDDKEFIEDFENTGEGACRDSWLDDSVQEDY